MRLLILVVATTKLLRNNAKSWSRLDPGQPPGNASMRFGHMRRIHLALPLLLALVLPDPASACSCVRNPTAEGILKNAAAVFTGTARGSVPVAPGRSVTTFTVVESFKGVRTGEVVRVRHPSGASASCGVKFAPGETQTLAAHRTDSDPGLTTSLCSAWMFEPQIPGSAALIREMRALTGNRRGMR